MNHKERVQQFVFFDAPVPATVFDGLEDFFLVDSVTLPDGACLAAIACFERDITAAGSALARDQDQIICDRATDHRTRARWRGLHENGWQERWRELRARPDAGTASPASDDQAPSSRVLQRQPLRGGEEIEGTYPLQDAALSLQVVRRIEDGHPQLFIAVNGPKAEDGNHTTIAYCHSAIATEVNATHLFRGVTDYVLNCGNAGFPVTEALGRQIAADFGFAIHFDQVAATDGSPS